MAKTDARKAGAFEAWLVDCDGFITEGASANAWIVTKKGVLVTRDLASNILAGVTRLGVLNVLAAENRPLPVFRSTPTVLPPCRRTSKSRIIRVSWILIPGYRTEPMVTGRASRWRSGNSTGTFKL
jgi:hypothetical protein